MDAILCTYEYVDKNSSDYAEKMLVNMKMATRRLNACGYFMSCVYSCACGYRSEFCEVVYPNQEES